MKQRTFKLESSYPAASFAGAIRSTAGYESASDRLVVAYIPADMGSDGVQAFVKELTEALPEAHVVGMTSMGDFNPNYFIETRIVCTLLLFESATVHARAYDCAQESIEDAAERFASEFGGRTDVRGALCLSSQIGFYPLPFVKRAANALKAPVFGSLAGMKDMSDLTTWAFVDGEIFECGIAAVVFAGEDLHICADGNLGWRPIGREVEVTAVAPGGLVSEIEGDPATTVYKKYLDVDADEAFLDNVCAFPLLIDGGDMLIARTPLGFTPDGQLVFGAPVEAGAKMTLSYSKNEYLLQETLDSANGLAAFGAEALLLFPCLNRRIFLGDDLSDREIAYFANANDQLAWPYGCGEILITPTGGGVLNSALVAVAMHEVDAAPSAQPFADPDLEPKGLKQIPLANRLATFLEAATSDLAYLALHDQLTGLYNRRRINELLKRELASNGDGDAVYLMMYDVDFFKNVNDTYGHAAGDTVLRELTACVRRALRRDDILGRWGGEEFMCVLRAPSDEDVLAMAERVRQQVEEHDFANVGSLTISLGLARAHDGDAVDDLFNRVDAALYQSKRAGRNRVSLDS